jgi:hypothetical protein
MNKIFWVMLFSLLHLVSTGQQVVVDTLCQKAYGQIMSLRFSPASRLLQAEKQLHPQNVYVPYLENYIDFLRIFIGENQTLFDQADNRFDNRYNRIKQLPDSSRYKRLMLANMNLQWAFARLKFGQYFTAAWEMNRAYRLLTENAEQFPGFVPNFITLGVLHVMIGLVPDKYHWMLKIIAMKGSVEEGKAEIYRALNKAETQPAYAHLRDEALFYLGFIELNLAPNQKALKKLEVYLQQTDNRNLLMDFLKADIYIRHGENQKALRQLNSAPQGDDYFPFYYLHYMKGECYLRKLSADSSMESYRYFLHHFEGLNYIKDAWRKEAWAALLQGKPTVYHRLMDSVIVTGVAKTGADKEALAEARSGKVPHSGLLRARLLFDGGYYKRSKAVLDTMAAANLTGEEQAERIYRYARIFHRLHRLPEAKKAYRQAILAGEHFPRYFAANAALKLGEIYESQDSLTLARYFYKKCLSLNFKEYQNSIRGKASDGLERIRRKQPATNDN